MKFTIIFIFVLALMSCTSSKKNIRSDFYFKKKHGVFILKYNDPKKNNQQKE
jgi:hypothetical protein